MIDVTCGMLWEFFLAQVIIQKRMNVSVFGIAFTILSISCWLIMRSDEIYIYSYKIYVFPISVCSILHLHMSSFLFPHSLTLSLSLFFRIFFCRFFFILAKKNEYTISFFLPDICFQRVCRWLFPFVMFSFQYIQLHFSIMESKIIICNLLCYISFLFLYLSLSLSLTVGHFFLSTCLVHSFSISDFL